MLVTRERSFTALHSENFGRIYRYIAYRISDTDRAEELAGDVFRIAWEKDLPEEPGIGWLIAAARNVVANEYKGATASSFCGKACRSGRGSQRRPMTMKATPWQASSRS